MLINRSMVSAVARQPRLWPVAARAFASLVPVRWWSRPPFLPVPDRDWLRFRLETAYGGDGTPPASAGDDLATWLHWLKAR